MRPPSRAESAPPTDRKRRGWRNDAAEGCGRLSFECVPQRGGGGEWNEHHAAYKEARQQQKMRPWRQPLPRGADRARRENEYGNIERQNQERQQRTPAT